MGTNWIPKAVGGQLEIRELPPAAQVYLDYEKWRQNSPAPTVRLYEVNMKGSSNQINLQHAIHQQEGVIFSSAATSGSFAFKTPRGDYFFVWNKGGRIPKALFELSDKPRRFLVQPVPDEYSSIPVLRISAVEGVESLHVEVAEP